MTASITEMRDVCLTRLRRIQTHRHEWRRQRSHLIHRHIDSPTGASAVSPKKCPESILMKSKQTIHTGVGNLQANKGTRCIMCFRTDTQITSSGSENALTRGWSSIKLLKYSGDLLPESVAGTSFAAFHIL